MLEDHSQPNPELNLFSLILPLWNGRRLILGSLVCSIVLALLFNWFVPKSYSISTSFLLPSSHSNELQLPGVLKSFATGGGSATFETYMETLFFSTKIKHLVTKAVYIKTHPQMPSKQELNAFKSSLQLQNARLRKHSKRINYILSYKNKDPELALLVLDEYMIQLRALYDSLELGAEKEQITILDEAVIPGAPNSPDTKIIFIMFIFLGGAFSVAWIYGIIIFQYLRQHLS